MRRKLLMVSALVIPAVAVSLVGMRALSKRDHSATVAATPLPDARATIADRQIQKAEARIRNLPSSPDGYTLLAGAYMLKARETGDFGFNARVESALKRALEISPDDQTAITLHATLQLTYHRFKEALDEATKAQKSGLETPDIYGVMTDAQVELGDYAGAIKAAQKMMDLRPDSSAYSRVSYLRALHGDLEGAIEAMRVAVKAANPANAENSGWYRVHLGLELMNAGRREEAEREFDAALQIFPAYHLALAAKGRARVRAGDFDSAVELYRRAQERVPSPEIVIALGDLYAKLGRREEAKRQYELVEFIEGNSASAGTYSRQLALFWADHDTRLDEALEVMRRERALRTDIYTLDALAWCQYKKGQLADARDSIEQAKRLGTRDARIFYHAGMIYDALGDRVNAAKYLKLALNTDRSFDVLQAGVAQRKLDELARGSSANSRRS